MARIMVITHRMLILMGNVDVESVVEYPTKTPGMALETGNAELTGMDHPRSGLGNWEC
jgi:hypothetical protein